MSISDHAMNCRVTKLSAKNVLPGTSHDDEVMMSQFAEAENGLLRVPFADRDFHRAQDPFPP